MVPISGWLWALCALVVICYVVLVAAAVLLLPEEDDRPRRPHEWR